MVLNHFFCIIAKILHFYCYTADEMDRADEELKETIRHIWPLQSKKMLELLVPPRDGKKI